MKAKLLGVIVTLLFVPFVAKPQGGVKKAMALMDKQKFEKAEKLILKSFDKDSLNAGGHYVLSRLFLSSGFPRNNPDSSYFHITQSLSAYEKVAPKQKKILVKQGVDSLAIIYQKARVDSAAFLIAKGYNSEEGYNTFLKVHQGAAQTPIATALRDSAAYLNAQKENTSAGYWKFLTAYPAANQAVMARANYERLLYSEQTKSQLLESFEAFIQKYPRSPYRSKAELSVFELSTADNRTESFRRFINRYPQSKYASKAKGILYHLLKGKATDSEKYQRYLSDSLRHVAKLDSLPLLLVFQNSSYGFINTMGEVVMPPQYKTVDEEYLCGQVDDDFLVVGKALTQVVARNGALIWQGNTESLEDLGYGLLLVEENKRIGVLHKGGHWVVPCDFEDAKVVNGQYVAVMRNQSWGLYTFLGREIFAPQFDNVWSNHGAVIIKKDGKLAIVSSEAVAAHLNQQQLSLNFIYDDITRITNGCFLVKTGLKEGVIGPNLQTTVPLGAHTIKNVDKGLFVVTDGKVSLMDSLFKVSRELQADSVLYSENWIAIGQDAAWHLYKNALDSAFLVTKGMLNFPGFGVAVVNQSDTTTLIFENGQQQQYSGLMKISILSDKALGKDGPQRLLAEDAKGQKFIFDKSGDIVYEGSFDNASVLGNEYIVVKKGRKQGLLGLDGKTLLPTKYEAIGNYTNGNVSLLFNRKFGLYRMPGKIAINTRYDRNIIAYNEQLLVAHKNGGFGLIKNDGRAISEFDYKEIHYWNDTTALFKEGENWLFYNLVEKEPALENLSSVFFLKNTQEESLAVVATPEGKGVFSSVHGEIIPPTFNDIINLGTAAIPIYFAEKHVSEADYYVVVYFDATGNIIKKQAYDAEDYEYIYCGL